MGAEASGTHAALPEHSMPALLPGQALKTPSRASRGEAGEVRALMLIDGIVMRIRFLICVPTVFGELSISFKVTMNRPPAVAGCLVLVRS